MFDIICCLLIVLCVILLSVILFKIHRQDKIHNVSVFFNDVRDYCDHSLMNVQSNMSESVVNTGKLLINNMESYQHTVDNDIKSMDEKLDKTRESLNDKMNEKLTELMKETHSGQNNIMKVVQDGLIDIQNLTEKKLSQMQSDVNKKLDVSLNDRLEKNFVTVSKRLEDLYKSLGELSEMSDGINSLNKTLTNVKTRGTWGEVQLGSILEDVLTQGQYDKNVKLRSGSDDLVEYAIKIPSKEDNGEYIWLPIDAKFPVDKYVSVIDASSASDNKELQKAIRALEQHIKIEARSIRDKYVLPPVTTDFAIMFLPTESMYAEVLRIDGLVEWCQTNCRVVISGPSTITALLNSLRIGFANLALNRKTAEVRKTLQAVKTQYSKLDELIDITRKKLDAAVMSTDKLKDRAGKIQRSMSKIDVLEDQNEADILLGMDTDDVIDTDI